MQECRGRILEATRKPNHQSVSQGRNKMSIYSVRTVCSTRVSLRSPCLPTTSCYFFLPRQRSRPNQYLNGGRARPATMYSHYLGHSGFRFHPRLSSRYRGLDVMIVSGPGMLQQCRHQPGILARFPFAQQVVKYGICRSNGRVAR